MDELISFSLQFFVLIAGCSLTVYLVRTLGLFSFAPAQGPGPSGWLAAELMKGFGIEREAWLARLCRMAALLTKYGIAGWALWSSQELSLNFWLLIWVLLLVLELMRKTADFFVPNRWEELSLKLDSEHFWLIHLIVLGVAESQLAGGPAWAQAFLLTCYLLLAGSGKPSAISALEDVANAAWILVALSFFSARFFHGPWEFTQVLVVALFVRGMVQIIVGKSWLQKRFWWIAQFCLMTALIIKALVVLRVLA